MARVAGEGTPPYRIDRKEALRYLGYRGQTLDADLAARFEKAVYSCEHDLSPACVWGLFDVDERRTQWKRGAGGESPHIALMGTPLTFDGDDIVRHMQGARQVVLMACTLGAACERELRKLTATSPTDALLYDAAASALIEAVADATEAEILHEATARGLYANARFSPGYGDLPLSVQPGFLAAIDATRRIGLGVLPDHMLVPTKSVTALVGLFDREPKQGTGRTSCAGCPSHDCCLYQEKGRTCHGS